MLCLTLWARAPSIAVIKTRALERAEQHVIDGERLIAQQKELIAKLLAGLDASACGNTLVRLEQLKVYAFNRRLS